MVAEGAVLMSPIASHFKRGVRRWTRWRAASKFFPLWRNHGASTVTESNVHEVMVDAARWEGRRSLLADAVAAALGVRVEHVRECVYAVGVVFDCFACDDAEGLELTA